MNTTLRVGAALVAASVLVIGLGACSSNGNNTASSSVTVMPLPSDDGTSGIPTSTVTPTASTEPNTAAARLEIQVAGNQLKDSFGPVICVDEDADGDLDVDAGVDIKVTVCVFVNAYHRAKGIFELVARNLNL